MNFKKVVLAGAIAAVTSTGAFAASDTFDIGVDLILPITVTKTSDMHFGEHEQPNGGGDLILVMDETAPALTHAAATAAVFDITGEAGRTVDFDIDGGAAPTINVGLGIDVDTFTFTTAAAGFVDNGDGTGSFDITGGPADALSVGGTLTATDGVAVAGSYTAPAPGTLTVVYQ